MGLNLSADEVLEIAQRMEQNGALFYRRAAELKEDNSDTGFLMRLAEMEDEHERIFREMQDKLSDEERSKRPPDPIGEMWTYLGAIVDTSGGEGSMRAYRSLSGETSMQDIFRTAIELEKESILFYIGLKDILKAEGVNETVNRIIDEERSHIVVLKKELDRVKK
jgi:rubrerythrin